MSNPRGEAAKVAPLILEAVARLCPDSTIG